jgi:hypothetical protein
MISDELLKMFCASDSSRSILMAPFSQGKYTYATNGTFGIRVERVEGYKKSDLDNIEAIFDLENIPQNAYFLLAPITIKCLGPCPMCGCGMVITKDFDYENFYLEHNLLFIMNKLPNVTIAYKNKTKYGAIPFRFDGGIGVIMPKRNK